jgi:hypothetical protein
MQMHLRTAETLVFTEGIISEMLSVPVVASILLGLSADHHYLAYLVTGGNSNHPVASFSSNMNFAALRR